MTYDIIPLCIDCEHYSKEATFHRCAREINPVDGSPRHYADQQRNWPAACGPSGRYFRLKEVREVPIAPRVGLFQALKALMRLKL